jgi:hypothetical protein
VRQAAAVELSKQIAKTIAESDATESAVIVYALAIMIGTLFAVHNQSEAELVHDINALRDDALDVFRNLHMGRTQ